MRKRRLWREKDEAVVRIPPVVRMSIIGVELQLLFVGIQVENIRIAIAIGIVRETICVTADQIIKKIKWLSCILFGIKNPPVSRTKLISFLKEKRLSSVKSLGHLHSQYVPTSQISESRNRLNQSSLDNFTKKISKIKGKKKQNL
ncbi:MAG: hypothetical protein US72_C0002G0054 [Microgenomates group bacterium GW2011_GWC1_38_12]|uniref:Uncharacterized protein n=1 Tax=Candidatus Vogelbacteria bacterium RIFOXYB1_FULL_42_16 TaxID=1802436 RepID=A0A1G2QEW1_9BACT|nr:MAG: hypothetical protein US72_C0002G0054 [Microgenomates group bacterium GW2011_GWC1_38_12]KKS78160.1 MAG: hypothetical protein UV50_C0001G0070 [Parcubacteria group bacterium GW2011_GWB1_42_9]OHA59114.1 MAG: hypothetical protein A2370_02930 [Candidatus Vogelbacteria bacterium RIFOXYB1_FULL_42_16]